MKTYTVSITLSIEAENEEQAIKRFEEDISGGYYEKESVEVEEEEID